MSGNDRYLCQLTTLRRQNHMCMAGKQVKLTNERARPGGICVPDLRTRSSATADLPATVPSCAKLQRDMAPTMHQCRRQYDGGLFRQSPWSLSCFWRRQRRTSSLPSISCKRDANRRLQVLGSRTAWLVTRRCAKITNPYRTAKVT